MGHGRNTYIDLMRAAAICPVVLGHWRDAALTRPSASTVDYVFSHLGVGMRGVQLFFVISGFVITRAAIEREPDLFALSYRTFYPRRFARIYPLLAVVCIIGIGLLALPGSPTHLRQFVVRNPAAVFDAPFWASLATFTFNIWRMVNLHVAEGWGLHWDVMWSLAVEEQFYIAFPLLLLISRSRRRLFLILLAIILLSVGYRLAYQDNYSDYDSLICFELIAVGVLTAVFVPKISPRLLSPLALLGGVLLCAGFYMPPLGIFRQDFIAIGAGILLCCAVSAPAHGRVALILPIAFIGELSYGMYLLHPMVLYAVGGSIRGLGLVPGFFVFIAATAALAALSYQCFEKPSERFVRNLLTERRFDVARQRADVGLEMPAASRRRYRIAARYRRPWKTVWNSDRGLRLWLRNPRLRK